MLKTELCEIAGIKYPIIQAGMGPFCTNNLAIASANAGVLGIISTSGFGTLATDPAILMAALFRYSSRKLILISGLRAAKLYPQ